MTDAPHRPRLLMAAAAILVADGGGKVLPINVARSREAALEVARVEPWRASVGHTFQAHITALADLIVSINAARDPVSLTVVK